MKSTKFPWGNNNDNHNNENCINCCEKFFFPFGEEKKNGKEKEAYANNCCDEAKE